MKYKLWVFLHKLWGLSLPPEVHAMGFYSSIFNLGVITIIASPLICWAHLIRLSETMEVELWK